MLFRRPNFCSHNLSSRIRYALKGGKKGKRTLQLTGCDVLFLRKYIESLWKQGMSWENYGMWKRGGKMTWHIDHIIPCDAFDLNKIENFYVNNNIGKLIWCCELGKALLGILITQKLNCNFKIKSLNYTYNESNITLYDRAYHLERQ